MTTLDTPATQGTSLKAKINARFDETRARLGFTTDAQLAAHYRVRTQFISYWRNLKSSRLDTAFAAILLGEDLPDIDPEDDLPS